MSYFITQVRRPGHDWAKLHVERTALAAAMALTDALTTHGMHHSDIHGLREDLVAGHVLTADDGYAFRIQEREQEDDAPAPRPQWMEVPAELQAADPESLLTAIEVLTHKIHGAVARCGSTNAHSAHRGCSGLTDHAAALRAQRGLVRAEILRRMGEAR